VDEPLSSQYTEIDGGFALVDTATPGTVPNSNKSIVASINGIDPFYSFIRIAVIASNSGTGQVNTVYISNPITITGVNMTYTVRDLSAQNFTLSSLDALQIAYFPVYKVGSHAQINNQLVIGNLSGKEFN
jgi:hypothetical protein